MACAFLSCTHAHAHTRAHTHVCALTLTYAHVCHMHTSMPHSRAHEEVLKHPSAPFLCMAPCLLPPTLHTPVGGAPLRARGDTADQLAISPQAAMYQQDHEQLHIQHHKPISSFPAAVPTAVGPSRLCMRQERAVSRFVFISRGCSRACGMVAVATVLCPCSGICKRGKPAVPPFAAFEWLGS